MALLVGLLTMIKVGLVFEQWIVLLAALPSHVLLGSGVQCPGALSMVQVYFSHLLAGVALKFKLYSSLNFINTIVNIYIGYFLCEAYEGG